MDSNSLRNIIQPFYSILSLSFSDGMQKAMSCIKIMEYARKTERANVIHGCIRESLRVICDQFDPILQLIEEPDGKGLDVIRVEIDDNIIALRWGRYDRQDRRIRRNRTVRADSCQQGFLFGEFLDPNGLPTATLSYELEDDYIAVGEPQWWMSRLVLRRERIDASEFIEEIYSYTNPIRIADIPETRSVEYITDSAARIAEIERVSKQLRRKFG